MVSLDKILGLKYPMMQGAMGRIADGSFAAECSNNGILGTIASGGMEARKLREEISICKSKTLNPFAVNVIMDHPDIAEITDILVSMEVPIVILSNGNALELIKKFKAEGLTVIPVLGVPEVARYYQRAGADAIIAEGNESGGHIGPMSTMTLVPQVCDEVDIPVIAAGGIADNRQFRAARCLGACGVQVGTALLTSRECPVNENYKRALLKAKGASTVVTGRILGDEARVLRNHMTKTYFEYEARGDIDGAKSTLESSYYKAVVAGDTKSGSVMAGSVCSQLHEIRPLKDIIEEICYGKQR